MDITIGTYAWGPIVTGLCQLAKLLGLDTKYIPLLNAGLTIVGVLLLTLVTQKPESINIVLMIVQMLIVFLTAAGLYTTANFANQRIQKAKSS